MRLLIALIVALASSAAAQPAVNSLAGDFDHGQTVYIYGSGFGSKSPAAPVLWDDFEAGTDGSAIGSPVVGGYDRIGITEYDTGLSYSGSVSAYSPIPAGGATPGLVSGWVPETSAQGFASMKFRINSSSGDYAPHNIKLLRLNSANPDVTHGYPNYNIGNERDEDTKFLGIVNHGKFGQHYLGAIDPMPHAQWVNISMWIETGDVGVDNGYGGREFNGAVSERSDMTTLQDDPDFLAGYRSAYFCGYLGSGGHSVDLHIDEVYADTTFARVFVSSASLSTAWGVSAMQLPTSWSSDEIAITVNTSAFATGETVYLWVVDADGAFSSPVSVEVGADLGGTGPSGVGSPGLSRSGQTLTVTWTAPTTAPDHYVVLVREGSDTVAEGYAVREDGSSTGLDVDLTTDGAVSVSVQARASDGSVSSQSAWVTDTP